MKIGLYLMNQKGLSVLEAIIDNGYIKNIGFVVSSKDIGLIEDSNNEILKLCHKNNIPIYDKATQILPEVDYRIAIGWRWLIHNHKNLIVLHDSILPRYRGFAPLVNSLINGESEIGVTALLADKEYDRGDIIIQQTEKIIYPIKIQQAIQKISKIYCDIAIRIFDLIHADKRLFAKPQDEHLASYSIWRDEDDYKIDWTQPADSIKRFIDAVGYPYKGAQTKIIGGESIYIDDATVIEDIVLESRHPGKVLRLNVGKPIVICGRGLIQLDKMRSANNEEFKIGKLRTRFKINGQ